MRKLLLLTLISGFALNAFGNEVTCADKFRASAAELEQSAHKLHKRSLYWLPAVFPYFHYRFIASERKHHANHHLVFANVLDSASAYLLQKETGQEPRTEDKEYLSFFYQKELDWFNNINIEITGVISILDRINRGSEKCPKKESHFSHGEFDWAPSPYSPFGRNIREIYLNDKL